MVKVIVNREKDAQLPEYKTKGSSGFDIRAHITEPLTLKPAEWALIPTGLKFEIPQGFEIQIRPRSGLAAKGIFILNSQPRHHRLGLPGRGENNNSKLFSERIHHKTGYENCSGRALKDLQGRVCRRKKPPSHRKGRGRLWLNGNQLVNHVSQQRSNCKGND